MVRLYFFLIFISVPVFVFAQDVHLLNNAMKDTIIVRYGKHDFKGIYQLGDHDFKANVTEEQLVGLLNNVAVLGPVLKSERIASDSSTDSYRLFFKKKSLQMDIGGSTPSHFQSIGFTFFKLPPDLTRTEYFTNNTLKTHLDSVVDKAARNYMRNKNVAGFSVGIYSKGEDHLYSYGETQKSSNKNPNSETVYEIGSITKTFTGILLAHAVLDKKISLEDDIRKYLKGTYPNLQYNGSPVRIVHLANHTSRLPGQPKLKDGGVDPFDPSIKFTDPMLDEILHNVVIDTIPGTKNNYSNFAVGLLGIILERVYKTSYENLLQKFIAKPYGMASTTSDVRLKGDNIARGYNIEGTETPIWTNRLALAAGGIRSNTSDMVKYMKAQINSKDPAITLSHQVTFGNEKQGTGLNWGIYTTKKGFLRWSHDGGTDGFTSLCLIYPQLDAGIITLTNNGDHDDQAFNAIATSIYYDLIAMQ